MAVKIIEIGKSVFASQEAEAARVRERLSRENTFLINLMASPGAGKTTLLLRTVEALRGRKKIGVMEADIDASVDADRMEAAGVRSIQVHTGGECAMNAGMVERALEEFDTTDLDILFLENVGNLVCPAEEDVGANRRVAILSVPEGDDKPLKYPLMFEVCDAVIISKIDTKEYFPFDEKAVTERIHMRNPASRIFFVSARTGEGMDDWIRWLEEESVL